MKDRTKRLLREIFTHSTAFTGGVFFEKWRQKKYPKQLEDAYHNLSLQEIEEMRGALSVLRELLLQIEPEAEARAIVMGVMFAAFREVPSLSEELGSPPENIEEMIYARSMKIMKEVAPSRDDLVPYFDLVATIVSKYTKQAVTSPSTVIPAMMSQNINALVTTIASNVQNISEFSEVFEEYSEELEGICAEWRRQGKPATYWITLQHLLNARFVV